jgi:microcystin degradation protein MlrC
MMEYSHCLIAYRENPHSDARESSIRAANLLDRAMATGIRPVQYVARPGIVWPPTGTGSADQPMRSLLQLARELERQHPSFQAINVVPGFAFGDTRDTGLAFSVATTGSAAEAREALDQLSQLAIRRAAEGCPQDADVDKVLTEFSLADRSGSKGPWVIAEPSDNVGGGAPGDATGLLRALLRHKISNAAVCLFDPEAVAELQHHCVGEMVVLSIGGKSTTLDPGPLEVSAKLLRVCDGRFELEDKQSHLASAVGDRFDMGTCAIIDVSGVTILLTSNRTMPMDLGQWRSVGLPPEQFAIVGVKAAVAHRRAYEPIAAKLISVDTPGPCQSNLLTLSFKNLRRPAFPFDPVDALESDTCLPRHPKD